MGTVVEVLGETICSEHELSLNDNLPFIPRKVLAVKATVLDIGAEAGLVVTERVGLDLAGPGGVPLVEVFLRSDNGTPDNPDDDFTTLELEAGGDGFLPIGVGGGTIAVPRPVFDPLDFVVGRSVPDLGDMTVTAEYRLGRAAFEHALGLGVSAAFTIEALAARLVSSVLPSSLQISFGPLLSLEPPDGGFQADLLDLFDSG